MATSTTLSVDPSVTQRSCQIGNLGLQHRVIKDWIEIMQEQAEAAK
jgi:hypothetical protein